jgi:thiol-disulfide isomerase/thioredoxin
MRLAFQGFFLVALIGIVYVLIRAAGGPSNVHPLARHARGPLEALSFATSGAAVPDAPVTGPDGAPIRLNAMTGKVLLVNVWATWCAPCEEEMPGLGALQKAKGGKAFEVIAISIDAPEDGAYARKRLGELGAANLEFYHSPPGAGDFLFDAGVSGFPTSILFDAGGAEVARIEGGVDWTSPEAVGLINALIAQ